MTAHVEPAIFPRRDPDPQNAESNGILPETLWCGGIIYDAGALDNSSTWAIMHRDAEELLAIRVRDGDH